MDAVEDYVAVGFDVAGNVAAFTTGTLECCQSAAKAYRRTKKMDLEYIPQ